MALARGRKAQTEGGGLAAARTNQHYEAATAVSAPAIRLICLCAYIALLYQYCRPLLMPHMLSVCVIHAASLYGGAFKYFYGSSNTMTSTSRKRMLVPSRSARTMKRFLYQSLPASS